REFRKQRECRALPGRPRFRATTYLQVCGRIEIGNREFPKESVCTYHALSKGGGSCGCRPARLPIRALKNGPGFPCPPRESNDTCPAPLPPSTPAASDRSHS